MIVDNFYSFLYGFRSGNCKNVTLGNKCETGLRKKTYNVLTGSVLSVWTQVEDVLTRESNLKGNHNRMQVPILSYAKCASSASFFDREQRELFLLAWNKVPKMLLIEQKLCMGTKNVPTSKNEVLKVPIAMEAKFCLHIMELNCHVCLVWPCMDLCGLVWSCCISPRLTYSE